MDSARFRFHLQVITNRIESVDVVAASLTGVLDAGADSVQLRDPEASVAQASSLIELILCERPDACDRLVVHEELAGPGTAGIRWRHLPGASLTALRLGPGATGQPFGASVHSVSEARIATVLGAAYLTFGHVFGTDSHPGDPARGVAALADVVQDAELPVLAIGGIDADNLDAVLATGCAGIAVISAVFSQGDPRAATRRLRDRLDRSPFRPRQPFPAFPVSRQKGML